jgi:hypothetical protein
MSPATAPQPAVMIASPTTTRTLTDDVPLRAQVDAVRLFNLRAFLASRGWQSRTDLASTDGIDQLVLIGRAGCSADELAHRAQAKLATFEGFGPAALDWSDIDDLTPDGSNARAVLAELRGAWPPQEWRDLALRDVTGPIPLAKAVGSAAVAATGVSFELLAEPIRAGEPATGAHVIPRAASPASDSIPLPLAAGDTRPRTLAEGGVVSADGEWLAELTGDDLTVHDVRRKRPRRLPGWVAELGVPTPVRLLAVGGAQLSSLEVVLETSEGIVLVVPGTARAPERLAGSARAAALVGRRLLRPFQLIVDDSGQVVDLSRPSARPIESEVSAVGIDAAEAGGSLWLLLWGTNDEGAVAEVHRHSARLRRWTRFATILDARRAGFERPGRAALPNAGVFVWVTRADGSIVRVEVGPQPQGGRA